MELRILFLEDSQADVELAAETLEEAGFRVVSERVETRAGFSECIQRHPVGFDVILLDLTLPSFDGLSAIRMVRERDQDVPCILFSGSIGEERAIEALKAGATDYVLKTHLPRLVPVVQRALGEAAGRRSRAIAEREVLVRARQHAILADLGQVALADSNPSELFDQARRHLLAATPADYAHLCVQPSDGGSPRVHATDDPVDARIAAVSARALDGDSDVHAASLSEPLYLNDFEVDTSPAWTSELLALGLRSSLSVPIRCGSRSCGTIRLYCARPDGFTPNDLHFVNAVSNLLGQTIARHRTQEDLERLRRQYELILRSVGDGIHGVDLDGNILFENPASARMLGWEAKDVVGRPSHATIHHSRADGSAYPREQCPIHRTVRDGRTRRVNDDVFWRKDGSCIPVEYITSPLRDDDGSITGAVVVFRDVTERRRAEDAIRTHHLELERRVAERTAELAAANRQLEAFSYSISHDLHAPVRAIEGYASILRRDHADGLQEEAREFLDWISRNARKMSRMIKGMMSLAHLGRCELRCEKVDMNGSVEEALQTIRAAAPESFRSFSVVRGDLSTCEGDPALLQQVWANLLGNAFKYSGKQADPRIETGCIRERNSTTYYVRDNGVGFDMAFADRLFGVFQRLHPEREFEGTGVGLATVHRILERHGGRVWAESQAGLGTTFYFTVGRPATQGATRTSRGGKAA